MAREPRMLVVAQELDAGRFAAERDQRAVFRLKHFAHHVTHRVGHLGRRQLVLGADQDGGRAGDRGERFVLCAVEEAAGIDDDEVGALMLARQLITFRAQPRDDALTVHQCLRAAEGDEAHLRRNAFVHRVYRFRQASASA